ncbi:FG-GAP repeat domain-containing protein [Denitrobaculum tricleocarpae]|uniref:VCBS repeat-containing protein n=1 Tax=Denitrobaculum tricleocarpae TaxID=2591009 RepID=A0A545TY32_9PROT|nr:VCBS repeat-containing protein [Denitrobaculum tricleocarpae]TQV82119.1 VCBS repeat-containing protein [Denitrobaculum tricleocarpae]
MKLRRLLTALVLSGLPVGTLWAADIIEISRDDICVSDLKGEGHLSGGIPTGGIAETVSMILCDGSAARLTLVNGKPELSDVVQNAVPVPRVEPVKMLPDSEITYGENDIRSAWLTGPTRRYAHAILGDAIEATGIAVISLMGEEILFEVGPESVFEDLRVRLVDLNGDDKDELIVIRSYLDAGAALAVYGLVNGKIAPMGETPAIGVSNRWLNPAGAADFDGDGDIEIAYVETPHIGGTLRFFSLKPEGLVEEEALQGFSNHAIGSRELDLGAVVDWNRDGVLDLAIPDASRSRLQVVSLAAGEAKVLASLPQDGGRHSARITTAVIVSDLDGDGMPELFYGLSDGSLVMMKP